MGSTHAFPHLDAPLDLDKLYTRLSGRPPGLPYTSSEGLAAFLAFMISLALDANADKNLHSLDLVIILDVVNSVTLRAVDYKL